MEIQQAIQRTKKLSIIEAMVFNGLYVGMQSFVMMSLAIFFKVSPFLISIISALPTAGYFLQIFTKKINRILGSRKRTLNISITFSRLAICILPFSIILNIKNQNIYVLIMVIYALFTPFVNNVWTSMMIEIIDKNERGKYFGIRNLFSSLTIVIYTLLYGYLLNLPNKETGVLLVTSIMSISAIVETILIYMHYVPELGDKVEKVSIKKALKNKNFVIYLKFASVWLFTWEFLKPLTEYYRVKVLGVNIMFISQMGVITALLSSGLYLLYGKLSDKYGNKTMLRMGIFFTTYYVLTYFSMTDNNKISMLFTAAIVDAIGFTAITLSLLNLMMEISEEPADAYVGAYAIVCGGVAILAGVFGGILGTYINDGVIYILGEEFYTIRFAFLIGFVLRLYSLLELTRVDSFEKTFVYSGSFPVKNLFSKRISTIVGSHFSFIKAKEKENEIEKENEKNKENIEIKAEDNRENDNKKDEVNENIENINMVEENSM